MRRLRLRHEIKASQRVVNEAQERDAEDERLLSHSAAVAPYLFNGGSPAAGKVKDVLAYVLIGTPAVWAAWCASGATARPQVGGRSTRLAPRRTLPRRGACLA